MTATEFGSRPALRAPCCSRPTHQPTRLGSASWMIAPSATRPVSSSAFGPYPAIHTGRRYFPAQSRRSLVPSYMTSRPSQRPRITCVASSRLASVVGAFPSTRRAESPRPMPRSIRPLDSSCSTARVLAVTDGSRVAGLVTQVPSRMRSVFCAIRVRSTYGSFQSTWLSKSQPYVKPLRSASRARLTARSSVTSGFRVNPNSIRAASLEARPDILQDAALELRQLVAVGVELSPPDRLERPIVMIERPGLAAVVAEEIGSHVEDDQCPCECQQFHFSAAFHSGWCNHRSLGTVVYAVTTVKAYGGKMRDIPR